MKKKRNIGRPPAKDPRVHLPNVVVRHSTLTKMLKVARESDKYLSYHVEKAFSLYLKINDN